MGPGALLKSSPATDSLYKSRHLYISRKDLQSFTVNKVHNLINVENGVVDAF